MRILYIPFFSNSGNHNGCSIYNVMKVVFRHWVDIDENNYVYFLLPENFPYKHEDIIQHPRIQKVLVKANGKQHDEKVLLPNDLFELFNMDTGKHYYDLVVCDKVQITVWVKMLLENKKHPSRVPYINFAQFIAKKDGRFKNILDEYEFSLALGWLAGFNIFQNKRHAERCYEIAKKYLNAFWVTEIMRKTFETNLFGIDTIKLNEKLKNKKLDFNKNFIKVNYAHRLATHYNPMFVLDVVDKVFSSGSKIGMVITTPTKIVSSEKDSAGSSSVGRKIEALKAKGVPVEVFSGLPQSEFYDKAIECDLFVSAIDETETANSIFEQLYLGQVGIFPDKEWVHHFLPKYPYIYHNEQEAYAWIKKFIENPKEMFDKIKPFRKMIGREWDIRRNSEKVLDWIKKDVMPKYRITSSKTNRSIEIAREVLYDAGFPKNFTFEEAVDLFKKYSHAGIKIDKEGYRGFNKFDWVKAILTNGYEDELKVGLSFKRIEHSL